MKDILGKLLGFVLLAGIFFGLFVVVVIPFELIKKAEAENWPARKGVITTSAVRHHRGRGRSGPYWEPEICGVYKDNGEKFCVARIRYGGFRWGEGKASAFETAARYPAGREIDIHYAPDDPKQTVLEARSPWTEMLVLLGLAITFLLLPLGLWLLRKKIEPGRYD